MNNRQCRLLKRAFDLPRHPNLMTSPQRMLYRSLKRRFTKLPSVARRMFLDNVTALQNTITTSTV